MPEKRIILHNRRKTVPLPVLLFPVAHDIFPLAVNPLLRRAVQVWRRDDQLGQLIRISRRIVRVYGAVVSAPI